MSCQTAAQFRQSCIVCKEKSHKTKSRKTTSAGGGLLAPNSGFLRYAVAFLDRMMNSLRFFVRCGSSLRFFVLNNLRFFLRCGSRRRAGTQLGLSELRCWTTCTMIVPPWNHDITSQTSSRFRWLHYQSSHILEKARSQN